MTPGCLLISLCLASSLCICDLGVALGLHKIPLLTLPPFPSQKSPREPLVLLVAALSLAPLSIKGLGFEENTAIQGVTESLESPECFSVRSDLGSFRAMAGPLPTPATFPDRRLRVSAIQCKAAARPERGHVNCLPSASGSLQAGSSCEFSCEQGFVLKGSARLQCGPTGEWDSEEPTCEGTVFVYIFF